LFFFIIIFIKGGYNEKLIYSGKEIEFIYDEKIDVVFLDGKFYYTNTDTDNKNKFNNIRILNNENKVELKISQESKQHEEEVVTVGQFWMYVFFVAGIIDIY
jgi:hypothetical protein